MKKIVILTGNELRHQFFRRKIALEHGIEVLRTYCETEENILAKAADEKTDLLRKQHLKAREQSEKDFFELFVHSVPDKSNAVVITKGEINSGLYFNEITSLKPDLIIVYGASILKEPLLSSFKNRILNVHLGLSPYYRGSATNFWPLVDELPECVGATFMYMDAGIDTGEIIHQLRATYNFYDTPSTVGNRLIKEMTETFLKVITGFDQLQKVKLDDANPFRKLCKKKDYTEASVKKVYDNFHNGMINNYLDKISERNNRFPIIKNPAIS